MQLRNKLILTGSVIAVFFLGYVFQAYFLYMRSERAHRWVTHTNEVLSAITQLDNSIEEYESSAKSLLTSSDENFKRQLINKKNRIDANLLLLHELTGDNPAQLERVAALQKQIDEQLYPLIKRIESSSGDVPVNNKQLQHVYALDEVQQQTNRTLHELISAEKILWDKRTDDLVFYSKTRFFYTTSGYLIMGIILAMSLYQISVIMKRRKFAEDRAKQSTKKYRSLIEDSALTSIVTDTEGNILFISKNVELLTGYSAGELKGKPITICMPRTYRDEIADMVQRVVATSSNSNTLELEIFTKSRINKWINCRIAPLRKDTDEVEELQIVIWDIDEEKRMREELDMLALEQKKQQQLLQNIIDNLPNFIFVKDTEGKYLLANKKLQQLIKVDSPAGIGVRITEFLQEENLPDQYSESDRQVIENKAVVSFEERYPVNGIPHYFQIVKFPLFDDDGNVSFICGITTDITEHRESENELRTARKIAEQAKTAQETFLANMSHEIRTPMNGIIGMSNLLLSTKQDEEQKEFTETILESSRNLLSIINDLLDFSKIKSGKFLFETAPFKVKHTIKKAIYPLQFKAEEKQIGLNLHIADEVPEVLIGDQLRLQQIVINLAGNAIKFTAKGAVDIYLSAEKIPDEKIMLTMDVTDSGIGIPENKLDYIFESFTQNNVNTSRQYGGTGLGLAIVKQLAEMQHGAVKVTSKIGAGSTFSVSIPFKVGKTVPVAEKNAIAIDNGTALLNGMQILVAEDNLINQKVVKNTLMKQGAQVDVALNGREAIDLVQQQFYDVILMDLQMPEVDGYKATRHIRQVLKINVPIIAMTADALKGEAEKCFEAGMNGFVSKPFDPNDLYQQLLKITTNTMETNMTQKTPGATDEPLIDLSYLHELSGNDSGYIHEVLNIFLDSTPEGLYKLEDLINNTKDYESIYRQAHFLKSSVSIVKIRKMYENLAKIESLAKKQEDTDQIPFILNDILTTFKQAHPMLIAERDRNNPPAG